MQAERTRWFSAMTEPPVNGASDSVYEVRCPKFQALRDGGERDRDWIRTIWCARCQWRGLTERGVRQWQRGAR